ncbi:hypothetical protein ACA910_010224 [Epithemia clementina (nom. ined.)]
MNTVLAMEFCFIPAIETLMHLRTALLPLVASYSDSEKTEGQRMTSGRFHSALIGSVFMSSCPSTHLVLVIEQLNTNKKIPSALWYRPTTQFSTQSYASTLDTTTHTTTEP